ncbi:hypothetical protein BLNAU_20462 [Blattamonas nauphoetae]|uniref:Biogenesis of lysosome-related organelles complex 1 subunit 3 n=1 Tax=Blattamonas nauphoetae TaxID=2049346 RepID=A0ABQ9WZQ9_9EUKA|nr:hypothetical protein BLNAU_20462 [Blattamonas nauphoetae]
MYIPSQPSQVPSSSTSGRRGPGDVLLHDEEEDYDLAHSPGASLDLLSSPYHIPNADNIPISTQTKGMTVSFEAQKVPKVQTQLNYHYSRVYFGARNQNKVAASTLEKALNTITTRLGHTTPILQTTTQNLQTANNDLKSLREQLASFNSSFVFW